MAPPPLIVVDTNVVVAGLRSRKGASHRLLSAIGTGRFEIALSVPLVLEYEDALHRQLAVTGLSRADVDAVLDYFCRVALQQDIFFLWRPYLPDPKDDMLLELAVAASCQAIVTHNLRDFAGVGRFGIDALPPAVFLARIGVLA
jgi:putative PIN family toxin of toxin-antitoxin system